MRRKFFSVLLVLMICLTVLSATARAAATDASYYDPETGDTKQISATTVERTMTEWTDGWYVMNGSVKISNRITVTGTVNLILTDGCDLQAQKGISVKEGNSLTIWGQHEPAYYEAMEQVSAYQLTASGGGAQAAIGGDNQQTNGPITINGGTVKAVSEWGAGIGGGYSTDFSSAGKNITINGGAVTAMGGKYSSGIGGGYSSYSSSTGSDINITGGRVIATGGERGAGIGGGNGGSGYDINISGSAVVEATGGQYAAGIGGGFSGGGNGDGRSITISGGRVIATGGENGAGIGGGNNGNGTSITISGNAVVEATGGRSATGIGGGYAITRGDGSVTISGNAVVKATGGGAGAGIGRGNSKANCVIRINGGTVIAKAGNAEASALSVAPTFSSYTHITYGGDENSATPVEWTGNAKTDEWAEWNWVKIQPMNALGALTVTADPATVKLDGENAGKAKLTAALTYTVPGDGGETVEMSADVTSLAVWSVTGGSGTTAVTDGTLVVDKDESANSLDVTAEYAGLKGTATVKIIQPDEPDDPPVVPPVDPDVPTAPLLTSVTSGANGVTVKWEPFPNAVKYRVFYKTGTGGWTKAGDTAATSYTWTGAKFGTAYTFTVRCINSAGTAYTSSFDTKGLSITHYLDTPQLTSVTNTAEGVAIRWGAVSGAAKYRIFYKTGTGGWTKLVDTTSTGYTWKGAKSGATYTFTVRCINSAGTGNTSAFDTKGLSITYQPATLDTPTLSAVTNTPNGVAIQWGAVSGAAQYRVFYKTGSGSWTKLIDTASTSYTWTGAKSGTAYTFTVRCLNSAGTAYTSAFDTNGLSITYKPTTLATPQLTSVTGDSKGITIQWGAVPGAAQYRVFYKTGSGGWTKLVDTTSTGYTWTGAVSGTTYIFTVRCLNSGGTGYTSDFDSTGLSITYTK